MQHVKVMSWVWGGLLTFSVGQGCASHEGVRMRSTELQAVLCATLSQHFGGPDSRLLSCVELLPSLYRLTVSQDEQTQVYRALLDAQGEVVKGLGALSDYAEKQPLNQEALTPFAFSELLLATEALPQGFHAQDAGKELLGERSYINAQPFKMVLLTSASVPSPPVPHAFERAPGGPGMEPPPLDEGGMPPFRGPGAPTPSTLHRATFEKDAQGWRWKVERRDPFTQQWSEHSMWRP